MLTNTLTKFPPISSISKVFDGNRQFSTCYLHASSTILFCSGKLQESVQKRAREAYTDTHILAFALRDRLVCLDIFSDIGPVSPLFKFVFFLGNGRKCRYRVKKVFFFVRVCASRIIINMYFAELQLQFLRKKVGRKSRLVMVTAIQRHVREEQGKEFHLANGLLFDIIFFCLIRLCSRWLQSSYFLLLVFLRMFR